MFAIKCNNGFVNPPGSPMYALVSTYTSFPYTVMDICPDNDCLKAIARLLTIDSSDVYAVRVSFPRGYDTESVEEYKNGNGRWSADTSLDH